MKEKKGGRQENLARKISTPSGAFLILVLEAIGIVLLLLSSRITSTIPQAVVFLISMIVIWYASHPLAHFIFANLSRVPVLYFYLAPSEMGKSGFSLARRVSPLLITIGTKLDGSRMSKIPSASRGWIYGSGALVGLVVIAIIESYAILYPKFGVLSMVLGGLFFLLTLGTELTLGAKSGDLSKMRMELSRPK